jgi:acetyl-CoA synthetase
MPDRYRQIYDAFRWDVPAHFNMADACCRRHADDPDRIALYWEDEAGATAVLGYRELLRQSCRLSNALTALGVAHGDRLGIVLAQRPETAVAHMACYQMGAVAMPLSVLFGPEALEYRLRDSGASVVLVEPASLENLEEVRDRLPDLKHVIGIAGARGSSTQAWEALLERAADTFAPCDTLARDPAVLIYTSGTTGPPKGALMPQQVILGNLPGYVYSHDGFPQPGDLFWSPADWAWTGGLMDALLPTLYFGRPLVGFSGRFDPERAFHLMEKYSVRNAFLFPTALKMMMKAVPEPAQRFKLNLRSLMSGGESVGETVFEWTRRALGVTVNEIFGQTEMNYLTGNSHTLWPAKPGSIGRPYPGHRVAVIDEAGRELPAGEVGEIAAFDDGDPVFFLEYWKQPEATRNKFTGRWCRTGDLALRDDDGDFWYQGRVDDVFKSAGYRIGPAEIENCLLKHPAVANAAVVPSPDADRGALVKAFVVLTPGHAGSGELVAELQAHVRGRLAHYEYPRLIEFIEALPMTTTGKVQRRVLRLREAERVKQA